MTQTITISKNEDLTIPWQLLKKASFPTGEFRLDIKKPHIFIVPVTEEKDWFDELLEDPVAQENFQKRIDEAHKEYRDGKTKPIEELFKELGV